MIVPNFGVNRTKNPGEKSAFTEKKVQLPIIK